MKLLGTFTSELLKLGVNIDKVLLKRLYDNLDPRIKKNAEIILLPIAAAKGVVYGMNNKTGMPVPFNFSRASSATLFDSNMDMKLADADIPRIDYGNYANYTKLLVEKQATNLLVDSIFELGINTLQTGTAVQDANWLGFIQKKAVIPNSNSTVTYYFYKSYSFSDPDIIYCGSAICNSKVYPNFGENNVNSEGRIVIAGNTRSKDRITIIPIKDTFYKISSFGTVSSVGNRGTGFLKYNAHSARDIEVAAYQLETGNAPTSYIPTADTPATRSPDLLRISLDRYAKVAIQTVNNGTIISDYITGDVDIHNLIPTNDAIVYLAIEYAPESVDNFINNLNSIGVNIDESAYINAYNSLSSDEKSAKIIFLPYAVSEGKVYAMDNTDGSVVEMNFQRSSSATMFNDNKEITSVGSNIPRIDHFNYSEDRKLLIEKQTTNYLTNSDFSTFSTERNNWVVTSYVTTALDTDHTVYTIINPTDSSRIQRTYKLNLGNHNISIYANAKAHAISFASFVNATIGTQVSPRVNEYAIHHCNLKVNNTADTIIRPYLRVAEGWTLGEKLFVKYIQIENSTGYTSFVPTSNSAATRSADLLSIDLTQDSSVYLKTTKQEVTLDKPAGVYNIHEDLSNEGILKLIIK